jgi:hypothetical protein
MMFARAPIFRLRFDFDCIVEGRILLLNKKIIIRLGIVCDNAVIDLLQALCTSYVIILYS